MHRNREKTIAKRTGEMAEWSIAAVLKTVELRGSWGSNPYLSAEYKNDIIIYKINVDNEKELAAAFGIQSIPTLLFIPAKGKPQLAQGALSKEQFVEQINGFLLGKK